jgi:hypothetical protein
MTATIATLDLGGACIQINALHNGQIVAGWMLAANKGKLAARLARAIEAGRAVTIAADGTKNVHLIGRTLDADLRRMGF